MKKNSLIKNSARKCHACCMQVKFLHVFGEALHAAGKYLGVFLYPSMDKAKYINTLPAVDHWLGTWGGKCPTIPNVLWALHHDNNVSRTKRANLMLYPKDAKCNAGGIATMFETLSASEVEEVGFWANSGDMGETWFAAMAKFLQGSTTKAAMNFGKTAQKVL